MSTQQSIWSCIVLGGGIAGLTLADKLSGAGVEVTLLERASFFGGLCRGVPVDGVRVDLGPHNLRTRDGRVLELWRELIGDELEKRNFPAKMIFKDALLSYPVNPTEVLRKLGLKTAMTCGIDLLIAKTRSRLLKPKLENYEDWAIANYGHALYEAFFKPLTEKVWGVPPQTIDIRFAVERLPPLSLRRALLGINSKSTAHREESAWSQLYYPRYGVYSLVEALLERLRAKNVRIVSSASIESIEMESGSAKVRFSVGGGGNESRDGKSEILKADYLASSIPIPTALRLLGKNTVFQPKDFSYRGVNILYLSVPDTDRLSTPFVYCADRKAPFNRLTDLSHCSVAACPPGRNIIFVERNVDAGTTLVDDAQSLEGVRAYVRRLGLLKLDQIFATHTESENFVYPLYTQQYSASLEKAYEILAEYKNLITFGRQGLFAHINTDSVMASAFDAAQLVLQEPFNPEMKRKFYNPSLSE